MVGIRELMHYQGAHVPVWDIRCLRATDNKSDPALKRVGKVRNK